MARIPGNALPDRGFPLYARFLTAVASRTSPGQSIVIAAPMGGWGSGYAYAYYRASYLLAGRRVIPLMDKDDRMYYERLSDGDLVAFWGKGVPPGPYEVVWRGSGGVLYRRAPH